MVLDSPEFSRSLHVAGFARIQPIPARSWIRQNSADPDLKSGDFSYHAHEPLPHMRASDRCIDGR
jgi:hypothetical protein